MNFEKMAEVFWVQHGVPTSFLMGSLCQRGEIIEALSVEFSDTYNQGFADARGMAVALVDRWSIPGDPSYEIQNIVPERGGK